MKLNIYEQRRLDSISLAWLDAFKTRPMLLRTACQEAEKIPDLKLALGIVCMNPEPAYTLNTRILGRYLKRVAVKHDTNGHRFLPEDRGSGSLYWSLVPCEQSQIDTPSPQPEPPLDIQGDIHLMAMTILEKLQPVLLNAIYTELMEHQK